MQINATTRVLSQPANFIRTNARAGIKNAVKGKNILVFVFDYYSSTEYIRNRIQFTIPIPTLQA